jgi:ATP-dependent RNA helicase DeaD
LQYYQNAPDINVDESKHFEEDSRGGDRRGRRRGREDRGGERNRGGDRGRGSSAYSRFFFNLGKKNGIGKRTIIDLINQQLPNKSVDIGNIEVLKSFSFFEVDSRFEKDVLRAFKDSRYKGQKIGIDIAKKK